MTKLFQKLPTMSPLGNNHPYPDKQCCHHSTKLSTIAGLRSKRFHVVSEQRTRNESQPPLPPGKKWLSFHFSRGRNRKSHSPSFLGLSLLQNHTEMLATQAKKLHETTTGDIHPAVQPCNVN